jgi:hypothetical protein
MGSLASLLTLVELCTILTELLGDWHRKHISAAKRAFFDEN